MVSSTLIRKDLKMLFRDPIMFLILMIPFLITAVVRTVIYFDPLPYLPFESDSELIFGIMRNILPLFGGLMSGWVTGFMILEERESGLEPQLSVTPLTRSSFLLTRLVLTLAAGILVNTLLWAGDRILYGNGGPSLLPFLLSGLIGPFIMAVMARWGKNRVQGLTLAKMSSLILVPPLLQFLLPSVPVALWIMLSPATAFMGDNALLFLPGTGLLAGYTFLLMRFPST